VAAWGHREAMLLDVALKAVVVVVLGLLVPTAFGESLGASVCGGLASELPPAALVLRSPFPSIVAMARPSLSVAARRRAAGLGPIPLAQQLADAVRAPLLVVVGRPSHAQRWATRTVAYIRVPTKVPRLRCG